MKVKPFKSSAPKAGKETSRKSSLPLRMLITIFFVCVATFFVTSKILIPAPAYLSKWALEHGHRAFNDEARLRYAYLRLPLRLVQSLKPSKLTKLYIDIKFKHLTKLNKKRTEALAKGILIQGPDDFVPATIRIGDQTTKVKLRLKGDWTDHLERKKWSFRVRVRGNEQILGMRRFSIQNPKVRGYQSELLIQETFRYFGVLVPRYFFVDVVVNGDNVGIMALEEHFSKELLESNGRRESVIIRFDESLLWAMRAASKIRPGVDSIYNNYKNSSIDAFQSSRIAKSESLSKDFSIAVGLLRGFVNGSLSASEVFNVELMGRFLGVSEFWGSLHALFWHNLRFYLNPISLRLEPIVFDADLRALAKENEIIAQEEPIVAAILKDPKIFKIYHETVQLLAKEILGGSRHQKKLELIEQKHLADLRREFYVLERYPYDKLQIRAKYLLSLSENGFKEHKKPTEEFAQFPTLIHAYRISDANGSYLDIANAIPHEVVVESVKWLGNDDRSNIEFQPLYNISFPILLSPTTPGSLPKTHRIFYRPLSDTSYSLEVTCRIQGEKANQKLIAKSYHPALRQNPMPDSSLNEQLTHHDFLNFYKENNYLSVQPGIWRVAGSLVVPAGITLKISAGTTLRFSSKAGLFSFGPLNFLGTKDDPIILEGIPSEEDNNSWQGVTVLNADSPSVWSHVTVRNTAGVSYDGWQLTGGVTFYKSDIRMNRCRFIGHRGEDALNIIHSKFELDGVEILETASDGLDADFSDGSIKDGIFQNIGNLGGGDAIDISGSEVRVTGSRLLNISDKALSVGEQSKMTAKRVFIEQVGTGAACKDGSYLKISDSSIKNAKYTGLMAYIKKPEFGSARIEANKIDFIGTASEARVQRGSIITLDGKQKESEDIEVEALYDTIMKPGLRK